MLDIINVNVLSDGVCALEQYVRVKGSAVAETGPMWSRTHSGADVIDGEGAYLCPGFIDIHNHGAMGFDTMDASHEAFDTIMKFHFEHGVSDCLLSTMTAPQADIQRTLDALASYSPTVPVRMHGAHMEGPYLSANNCGVHPRSLLKDPDEDSHEFIERNAKVIRMLTIAPNLENAASFISYCTDMGIAVFGGHDNAINCEIDACITSGMSGVTHLYCCTSTVGRRTGSYIKHTGLVEFCLGDSRLFAEIIADGYSVPEDLFRLVYKCKGYEKIILVSDSMMATGLGTGFFRLGSGADAVDVEVQGDVALLAGHSVFAGSVTTMAKMVARLIGEYGIPAEHVSYMASGASAALLGLADSGAVKPGFRARLNLLDNQGNLKCVIADETIHYREN